MAAPFLPQIFAYGFRNPHGISFRPSDNVPFIIEHGPSCDDEITPIRAGGNGGWAPGGYGRLRTAVEAPDGRLDVLTDANPGRILLVQPVI